MEIVTYIIIGIFIGSGVAYGIFRISLLKRKDESQKIISERDTVKIKYEKLVYDFRIAQEKLQLSETTHLGIKSDLDKRVFDLGIDIIHRDERVVKLSSELASEKSNLVNITSKLNEQKHEFENLREKLNIEFKNLANDILEEKSKKFTEQNKENISDILKPLNEKIKDFEKKVEDTYNRESKERFSLKEEVKRLSELNQKISKEATDLTNALKGQAKTQGNWGEMILINILEKSGLVKDREYYVQPSYKGETGKRLQPDIVITYPGDRNVVVDSKVSLVAFERLSSATTVADEVKAGKEHLRSIRNHIADLSSKNYQDIYQLKSLDFVMMFLPVEPAYIQAIQLDPELWNYAYQKRILLISPTNLITALKLVASLWRQEYQNKNVQEIARQSGDLYDKFVGFLEDLEDIGKRLKSTENAYQSSMNKLYTGRGNLIKRAEDIKSLGAKTKKNIPENVIEKSRLSS